MLDCPLVDSILSAISRGISLNLASTANGWLVIRSGAEDRHYIATADSDVDVASSLSTFPLAPIRNQ